MGDVGAVVTANNDGSLKSEIPKFRSTVCSSNKLQGGGGSSSHLVEYVATFPNVTVNAGDEYKACVLTTKDLSPDGLICNTGQNSPANRPEFVDISLNATTTNSEDRLMEEGEDRTSEDEDDRSFLSVKQCNLTSKSISKNSICCFLLSYFRFLLFFVTDLYYHHSLVL